MGTTGKPLKARIISVTRRFHGAHSKFIRRLEHVRTNLIPSLLAIGLEPDIFPAVIRIEVPIVDGVAIYGSLRIKFGEGCIGNLLSNYELWKLSATTGEPLLILEDDALLPAENELFVANAIQSFLALGGNRDILYLLGKNPSLRDRFKSYEPSETVRLDAHISRLLSTDDLSCTAAYLVTPTAAQALMDRITHYESRPTDGYVHTAFRSGEIGVLVQPDPKRGFLLNDNWADWNHKHDPSLWPK